MFLDLFLVLCYLAIYFRIGFVTLDALWYAPVICLVELLVILCGLFILRFYRRREWIVSVEDAIKTHTIVRVYLGRTVILIIAVLSDRVQLGSPIPMAILSFTINPVGTVAYWYPLAGLLVVTAIRYVFVSKVVREGTNHPFIRSARLVTAPGLLWSACRIFRGHADFKRVRFYDGGVPRASKLLTETCTSVDGDRRGALCSDLIDREPDVADTFTKLDSRDFVTRALGDSHIYGGDAYSRSPVTFLYVAGLIYAVDIISFGTSGGYVGFMWDRSHQSAWKEIIGTIEATSFTFFLAVSILAIMFPKTLKAHLTFRSLLVDSCSKRGWGTMFAGVRAAEVNACVEEVDVRTKGVWKAGTGCFTATGPGQHTSGSLAELYTTKGHLSAKWGVDFANRMTGEPRGLEDGSLVFHAGAGSRTLSQFEDDTIVGGGLRFKMAGTRAPGVGLAPAHDRVKEACRHVSQGDSGRCRGPVV